MNIGVLKEPANESRVSVIPEAMGTLKKLKLNTLIESGAGEKAFFTDEMYESAGAKISSRDSILESADIVLSIHEISEEDLKKIKKGAVLIGVYDPFANEAFVKMVLEREASVFSLDMIPRITRGQSMDVLSSMSTVSGYKAVLESALLLPKFFPMFMTAAGTITPAKLLVLGVGVAGLQAIATARRLGAQVHAFDVRSAVKEQVLSLGAKFVEVEGAKEDVGAGGYAVEQTEEFKKKQQQAIHDHAIKSNVVICTAQIPRKKAPLLISKKTVEAMQPGSVIIDLAASTGGNCEVTKNNDRIMYSNVKIVGESNYATQMPIDASKMFGQNLLNFLKLIVNEEGALNVNFEDDIVAGTCITHSGEIYNERVKSAIEKS